MCVSVQCVSVWSSLASWTHTHTRITPYFVGLVLTNEHCQIFITTLWAKPAQYWRENIPIQRKHTHTHTHTHTQGHTWCVSVVLCQPFWFIRPIDNSSAYLHSHHTDVWMRERKRTGGGWESRGEMGKREGKKLMRRLEDVPDLRCLKEIKTGKRIEDRVCVWVHRRAHVCAGCSPSVYLSLFFMIRPWLKKMHLIVFPRLCESAASLMCSIYQRVTSGGLHLFTGSSAGATDWNILRSNLWLVQLSDKMLAFDLSANHWYVHVCTLYIGYRSMLFHIHITCLWLIYQVVEVMRQEL